MKGKKSPMMEAINTVFISLAGFPIFIKKTLKSQEAFVNAPS